MSRSLTNILFYGDSSTIGLIEQEAERISSVSLGIFTEENIAQGVRREKMDIHLMERIEDSEDEGTCHLLISGYSLNHGPEQWMRKMVENHGVEIKYTDLSQSKNFFISIEGSTNLKKIVTPYISERSISEYGAESFYESVIRKVKGRAIYHRHEIARIATLFLKNNYATKEDILRDWEIPYWSLITSVKSSCEILSPHPIPVKMAAQA